MHVGSVPEHLHHAEWASSLWRQLIPQLIRVSLSHTKSATQNCRGFNLVLCFNSTLLFKASELMRAYSRISSNRSKFTFLPSLDSFITKFWNRGKLSWISTSIMASDPYTKSKGVSLVVVWCELILDCFILDVTLYLDWDFFSNYKVITQRWSPLDTNLTKWLSKCEGLFLEDKGKIQEYGDWRWRAKCKRAWKEKQEHNENQIDKGWKQEHKNTQINGIMERMEEVKERKSLCDGREVDHTTWSVVFLQDKCWWTPLESSQTLKMRAKC